MEGTDQTAPTNDDGASNEVAKIEEPIKEIPETHIENETKLLPQQSVSRWPKFKLSPSSLLKPSRAYLAEYAVLIIVTAGLLGLVNSMFGSIIDYFGAQKTSPRFGGDFAYTASISTLAAVAVLIPVLAFITSRTATSEAENPKSTKLSWRKAFLSIFLIGVMLTAIGYTIAFVYELFSSLASSGLGASSHTQIWRSLVKDGFAIVLFGFTTWLYASDYRHIEDFSTKHHLWRRIHRYTISILALVLAILFVIWPLRVQRNYFIDATIVSDLDSIKTKVTDYGYKKNALPADLSQLDLSTDLKDHASSFGYEYSSNQYDGSYKLCADFKTDTRDKEPAIVNPLEQFTTSSSSYSAPNPQTPDISVHNKGHDCFTFTDSNVGTYRGINTYNTGGSSSNDYLSN